MYKSKEKEIKNQNIHASANIVENSLVSSPEARSKIPLGRENYNFKRHHLSCTWSSCKVKGRGNKQCQTSSSSDECFRSETTPHWT